MKATLRQLQGRRVIHEEIPAKQIVVFCDSYPQIENALYLITSNYHDSLVTIVTHGNRDLFKFFQALNDRLFTRIIVCITATNNCKFATLTKVVVLW